MNAAIANHLNVAENAIIEVQEWARVLWVRVRGIGARFVSKKVVKMELAKLVGSEKQIKWAEKIRESAIAASSDLLKMLEGKLEVNRVGDWNQLSATAFERMHTCTSAKLWIEAKSEVDNLIKNLKVPYMITPASVVLVTRIGDRLAPKKVIG